MRFRGIGLLIAFLMISGPALSAGDDLCAEYCDTRACDSLGENWLGVEAEDPCAGEGSCDCCGLADDAPTGITGDWKGLRKLLLQNGIEIQGDVIQFYQGVGSGGTREAFSYAGHGDYTAEFDFDKLVDLEGWSLLVRTEHRWGEGTGRDAGVLFPPSLHAVTPTIETEQLLLTNVLFSKVVNSHITTFFGKLDTLDGDRNPFASGRGKSQFMNTNLLIPVGGLPTVPLATLGAGAVFFVDGLPLGTLTVLNATDTVTTAGFDELFRDGALILSSINVPLPLAGKTGIHTFTAGWSSKEFVELGQDPRIILPNVPLQRTNGSWLAWWSGAQYLVEDKSNPLTGWGLFGRAGAADPEVNPVAFFYNAGIGGQSPFQGRERDQFGIGWFYNRFSDKIGPVAITALDLDRSSSGVELYYNYSATENFRITPDLQVLEPGSNRASTALVLGVRAELVL